eukprot:7065430-Pyramimonas_sp.AAC.1
MVPLTVDGGIVPHSSSSSSSSLLSALPSFPLSFRLPLPALLFSLPPWPPLSASPPLRRAVLSVVVVVVVVVVLCRIYGADEEAAAFLGHERV